MDKEKDILTQLFRQRLEDYEKPVSEDLWAKITADLPAKSPSVTRHLWMKIGTAAAIVAVGLFSFWFLQDNKELSMKQTDSLVTISGLSKDTLSSPSGETTDKHPLSASTFDSQFGGTKHKRAITKGSNKKEEEVPISYPPIDSNKLTQKAPQQDKNEKQDKKVTPEKQNHSDFNKQPADLWVHSTKKKKHNPLSFALAYGNQGTSPSNSANVNEVPNTSSNIMMLRSETISTDPTISETDYKMPITASFSVRKHFTSSWALESGLTYSYLESTETLTNPDSRSSSMNYQLNYIGIPLRLVYSLYTTDRLSIYLSTGGMAEKCVSGKKKSSLDQTSDKLDVSEIQWSLAGNAGLNYRLVDHLGLFLEPGLAYYFDDHSSVMTIRKDKPLNFNLQFGLRLTY